MLDQGEEVLRAHLDHLRDHSQDDLLAEALEYLEEKNLNIDLDEYSSESDDEEVKEFSCPGSVPLTFRKDGASEENDRVRSRLRQWPVQLHLVPPSASYFDGAELVIAADCVPFAYGNFHEDFLGENSIVVGCPKLDDPESYVDKLRRIFEQNDIRDLKVVHMEVPCCFGLNRIVKRALEDSGSHLEPDEITIGIDGEIK